MRLSIFPLVSSCLLLLPSLTLAQLPINLTGCMGDCVDKSNAPKCATLDFHCWCSSSFFIELEKCAIDVCALTAPRDILFLIQQFCEVAGAPISTSLIPTSWFQTTSSEKGLFSTTGTTTVTVEIAGTAVTTLTVPLVAGGGAVGTKVTLTQEVTASDGSVSTITTEINAAATTTTDTETSTASGTGQNIGDTGSMTTTMAPTRTILVVPGASGGSSTTTLGVTNTGAAVRITGVPVLLGAAAVAAAWGI